MPHPSYFFDIEGAFVVENYNDASPFSGFLPGIAGTMGRPAWAFYVNRGQAIASFGARNKDGAILEFYPADKAYQLTASRGFRTFLKIPEENIRHEPFRRGAGKDVKQRLYVTPHEVGIEEINQGLGLEIRVDYFTLPEAPLSALVRRVKITNTSSRLRRIEIVDGLPQILPFGMNQWCLKFMSRTHEAYMVVEGVEENSPFYRLKVWPTDTPQVEAITAGNFFAGFQEGRISRVLVDAERVFGLADDFSVPERFYWDSPLEFGGQVKGNRTPSAFQALNLELGLGESRVFHGIYGHAPSREELEQFLAQAITEGHFEQRREINRNLVEEITQRAFSSTSKPLFDAHARQCYLDNGLRGGFSREVPGGARLYLFGRKHGDLERDYNDFLLQDTPFSEGNGDFRDVLQNRRMDLFFDPRLGDRNIRYFFNLIQPDGYNPVSLRNNKYLIEDSKILAHYCERFPGLEKLLAGEFKYSQLWQAAEADESAIREILAKASEIEDAEFDRGYWSDHWTYLVDLLIGYAAIFPDKLAGLFLQKDYTFFDPTHCVQPRSKKYVETPKGLHQYGAVLASPEKMALIASRNRRRCQVRSHYGKGEVVHTSLLGKILTLVANKLASLDPFGVGIEMEADRPGWCDALNGLPGLFGSAVNETIELKRLADFTREALDGMEGDFSLPTELAEFIAGLKSILQKPGLTTEAFWREGGKLKENYRKKVFFGFDGVESCLSLAETRAFLFEVSAYLDQAIARARTSEGIVTFFAHEVEWTADITDKASSGSTPSPWQGEGGDGGRMQETPGNVPDSPNSPGNSPPPCLPPKMGRVVDTIVSAPDGEQKPIRFRQKPLPLFLEGFVHALRIASPEESRSLYEAAHNSQLYDQKLGMFRLNAPLGEDAMELGRIGIFNYGWLENGSIFLHMHYKFVLEMVRAGLMDEFYDQMEKLLVAFRNPEEYRRSPIENSSFLVCSGFTIDPREHGRGCVARLSGSTVEFLHIWTHLLLGPNPFIYEDSKLIFRPSPSLAGDLFTAEEKVTYPFGEEEQLPENSIAFAFLGNTLAVYINPSRRNTYGPDPTKPCRYRLYDRNGNIQTLDSRQLEEHFAKDLREGCFRRVDIYFDI